MLCNQDAVLDRTFEAVKEACDNLRIVTVGSGMAMESSAIINRTLRLKDGTHQTVRQAHPCPQDEDVESLGPVDPSIGILRFDSEDAKPYAILYTYSCHPLLGVPDKAITANFPGFASKLLRIVPAVRRSSFKAPLATCARSCTRMLRSPWIANGRKATRN